MTMHEYETFELKARRGNGNVGEYAYLLDMPVNSHKHFAVDGVGEKKIRTAMARLNKDNAEASIHFAVYRVDETDLKGPGVRVLRDDKQTQPRTPRSKVHLAA